MCADAQLLYSLNQFFAFVLKPVCLHSIFDVIVQKICLLFLVHREILLLGTSSPVDMGRKESAGKMWSYQVG